MNAILIIWFSIWTTATLANTIGNIKMMTDEVPSLSNQYHTQDKYGRYAFGYNADVSSKEETRTVDGKTDGTYSYIDGRGDLQTVKYTADHENGFRVISATNLPKLIGDTDEGGRTHNTYTKTYNMFQKYMMDENAEDSQFQHDQAMRVHEEELRVHEEERKRMEQENMRKHEDELHMAEEMRQREKEIKNMYEEEMRLHELEMKMMREEQMRQHKEDIRRDDELRKYDEKRFYQELIDRVEENEKSDETRNLPSVFDDYAPPKSHKLRFNPASHVSQFIGIDTTKHPKSDKLDIKTPYGFAYSYPKWRSNGPWYDEITFGKPILEHTGPYLKKSVVGYPTN